MKRQRLRLVLSFLFLSFGLLMPHLGEAQKRDKVRTNSYYTYQVDGVTYMAARLDTVLISKTPPSQRQLRRGKRKLRKFTKLRWNVHKTFPYAEKVGEILQEVQAEMDRMEDEKELKEYIKEKEQSLFGKYEKDIRKMSRSQGKILVQLVHRQTGDSMYDLIKSNKNGASALFWQSIGLIFGINLKKEYDPEEQEMVEFLVSDLEQGGYNIVFKKYNFSLD